MNRRESIGTIAGAVVATVAASRVSLAKGDKPALTPVAPGGHKPAPLPFNPAKLTGLSEKLLTSHHDNNYAGAVKNLNAVELELDKVTKDTPGFVVAGLRERELTYANSAFLHERYFENLGGDGKPSGDFAKALATQFGTEGRWEELARATAMALGGGSGWVVIALSPLTNDLRIVGTGGHALALAAGTPLLVLDMFEHAYAMDYGAKAAAYVDAFMQGIRWDTVATRFETFSKQA